MGEQGEAPHHRTKERPWSPTLVAAGVTLAVSVFLLGMLFGSRLGLLGDHSEAGLEPAAAPSEPPRTVASFVAGLLDCRVRSVPDLEGEVEMVRAFGAEALREAKREVTLRTGKPASVSGTDAAFVRLHVRGDRWFGEFWAPRSLNPKSGWQAEDRALQTARPDGGPVRSAAVCAVANTWRGTKEFNGPDGSAWGGTGAPVWVGDPYHLAVEGLDLTGAVELHGLLRSRDVRWEVTEESAEGGARLVATAWAGPSYRRYWLDADRGGLVVRAEAATVLHPLAAGRVQYAAIENSQYKALADGTLVPRRSLYWRGTWRDGTWSLWDATEVRWLSARRAGDSAPWDEEPTPVVLATTGSEAVRRGVTPDDLERRLHEVEGRDLPPPPSPDSAVIEQLLAAARTAEQDAAAGAASDMGMGPGRLPLPLVLDWVPD